MKKPNTIRKYLFSNGASKSKNIVLIPLLIINLVVFSFPAFPVLAEESTEITTGDATVQTSTENTVNTSITEVENNSQESVPPEGENIENEGDNQENNGEVASEENNGEEGNGEGTLQVENENTAQVENNIGGGADTGSNSANENENSSIETGNANVSVNVENEVNTNIIGSDFEFEVTNVLDESEGDINLNNLELNQTSESEDCCLFSCVSDIDITNDNTGTITNNIEVSALTGENSASSNDGTGYIDTGNANVAVNVVNLLNTNLIGSSWKFYIFNISADWAGDLIFPGKEAWGEFLASLNSSHSQFSPRVNIENSSEVSIENSVQALADTGENEANGNGGDSFVETGNATVQSNILNIANTNIFGSNWAAIEINNVSGNWGGNLFSVPPGLSLEDNPDGFSLFSYPLGNLELEEELNEGVGEEMGGENNSGCSLNVTNTNTGSITNNINALAQTGGNSANQNGGAGIIRTGNARVLANIFNLANTNIIGKNWFFALINIFGNWQGDVAFGRPDLWIGISASSSNGGIPWGGDTVTYTLTYMNNGDADATGVVLVDDFDERYSSVADPMGGTVINNPGEIQWEIGTVPAGASGSISYTARVNEGTGGMSLTNASIIDSTEDDWNNTDNTDTMTLGIGGPHPVVFPALELTKIRKGEGPVRVGETVDYQITLFNNGLAPAYNVIVEDVLTHKESSEVLNTQSWNLGEVASGEKIIIDYTAEIKLNAPGGTYENKAQAIGEDSNRNPVKSSEVSTIIEVISSQDGSGEEEPLSPEGILEEIKKKLDEIEGKVKIIREEIQRVSPPPQETSEESFIDEIQEILLPEASAEEITGAESQVQQNGLQRFLASIGNILSLSGLRSVFLVFIILLFASAILSLISHSKKKK